MFGLMSALSSFVITILFHTDVLIWLPPIIYTRPPRYLRQVVSCFVLFSRSQLASRHQRLTPIMLASTRHSLEVVELLLDLGADINTSIPPNKTALGAAIES